MITYVIIILFSILSIKGLIEGIDPPVTQTPLLWKSKGDNAEMNCSHTKGMSYYQMYWYRQLLGEPMKLIVFTATGQISHDFGDNNKDKYDATKTVAESGTFTVKNVDPSDNGLYFCAVYEHSDADDLQSCTKTLCTLLHPKLSES